MQKLLHKKTAVLLPVLLLIVLFGSVGIWQHIHITKADTATAVTLAGIDYDTMELELNNGNNSIIYYSSNKTKWNEVETLASTCLYDISWISASSTTTLYFRGNSDKTTLAVKIPGYNKDFKVTFDKVNGDFDFSNTEGASVIRWRKTTDYNWRYVNIGSSTSTSSGSGTASTASTTTGSDASTEVGSKANPQSLEDFQKEVDNLRVKGTKLIFQIAPVNQVVDKNTGVTTTGSRASKEVTVTISAKKAAPSIKVNIKKMTVNTSTKLEWTKTNPFSSSSTVTWSGCTKSNMSLTDLAQEAINGTSDVTLYLRTAATTSNCASKVAVLSIPKRAAAPTAPASITYTAGKKEGNGKAVVSFTNVPTQGYEYTIVKSGTLTDETKVSWKTIKKSKEVKFSQKSLPTGAIIYVRTAGVAANANKGIDLQLPSQYMTITVGAYPSPSTTTTTGSGSTTNTSAITAMFR